MIKLILGGVGSGKSVTATKFIVTSKNLVYGNYSLYGKNGYHRLKYSDVIEKCLNKHGKKDIRVNWDFWKKSIKKFGGFHIVIDEIHNLMHSRRSMSQNNIQMSKWVSQIRKLTGSNEYYDFVCISQELERIDISIRDLAHEIIWCQKIEDKNDEIMTIVRERGRLVKKLLPSVYIILYYFSGIGACERYRDFRFNRTKVYNKRSYFLANPFFKYYDSYELIDFGEDEYL